MQQTYKQWRKESLKADLLISYSQKRRENKNKIKKGKKRDCF